MKILWNLTLALFTIKKSFKPEPACASKNYPSNVKLYFFATQQKKRDRKNNDFGKEHLTYLFVCSTYVVHMAWDGVELSFPQLSMIYEDDDTKKWYSKRTYGSKSYIYQAFKTSRADSCTWGIVAGTKFFIFVKKLWF